MSIRRSAAIRPSLRTTVVVSAAGVAALLLSGCGTNAAFPNTTSQGATMVISGNVHGGQPPVTGATIQIYQAVSTAYGAASTPLITPGTGAIGSNGYVPGGGVCVVTPINAASCLPLPTTDANGAFSVTGDYTCTAGAQVYLLATGGNPGLGAGGSNSSIALMAGAGACPQAQTFAAAIPYVFVNEVSTVATAYALAGFFTDATHLATNGSPLATTGITNAGNNIALLYNIGTGQALATTPNGLGTVSQSTINTVANILAYCINSNGSVCGNLFSLTKNGSVTPTETATAAINIAKHPGTNVTSLYNLVSATGPFQPTLPPTPNDFSVAINYVPATPVFGPQGSIAIDAAGNVWGPGHNAASAIEVNPLGAQLTSIGFTPTGNGKYQPLRLSISPTGTVWVGNYGLFFAAPTATTFTQTTDTGASWANSELAVAFDSFGNVWSGNQYPASFGELSASGVVTAASKSGYAPIGFAPTTNPVNYPAEVLGVAVDSANHIWGICGLCVGSQASGNAAEITSAGVSVPATADAPASIQYPSGLAIDASNNAWISDFGTGVVTEYNSTSTLLSGSGFPAGGGLGGLNSLAIDGSSNIFVAGGGGSGKNISGQIYELNNAGALISPASGYHALSTVTFYYPNSIAVDGSGNVWALDYNGGLHETIGIATPVVTPITSSALGQRP